MAETRNHQQHNNQQRVIKWPDPKGASSIEISKVSLFSFRIQQYAGYQKPGENKKEVDADPPICGKNAKPAVLNDVRMHVQHRNERQRAHSVQLRDSARFHLRMGNCKRDSRAGQTLRLRSNQDRSFVYATASSGS